MYNAILLFPSLKRDKGYAETLQLISPKDLCFLNEIKDIPNHTKYVWKKPFLDRVFDITRIHSMEKVQD